MGETHLTVRPEQASGVRQARGGYNPIVTRKTATQQQKETAGPAAAPAPRAPAARPRPTAPGEAGLGQVLAAARARLTEQILDVRCVERYDALATDEGRYEVKTATRTLTAIRSRMGEVTLLDGTGE